MNKFMVVSGDVTLDNNTFKGERSTPDEFGHGTMVHQQLGGSYLLHRLIEPLVESINQKYPEGDPLIVQYGLTEDLLKIKKFPPALQTYAVWQQILDQKKKPTGHWKLHEPLGFGSLDNHAEESRKLPTPQEFYQKYCVNKLEKSPDMLVFDDCGSFFGEDELAWRVPLDAFIRDLQKDDCKAIILKLTYPLSGTKLFQVLSEEYRDQLTIVISAAEIRREDVLVTKDVSWEQTALDMVQELCCNPALMPLLNCHHLFINFGSEGALYIEMKGNEIWRCRLVFDPDNMEGEWKAAEDSFGRVIGLQSCFVAGVVFGFMQRAYKPEKGSQDEVKEKKDRFVDITLTGALSAMRRFKTIGHVMSGDVPELPVAEIGKEIMEPASKYSSAFVPIPKCKIGNGIHGVPCSPAETRSFRKLDWTILEGNYHPEDKPMNTYQLGMRLALQGEEALEYAPHLRLGGMTLFDRREIEAVRNLRTIIGKYLRREEKGKKPLSLAVFGTPGSGKSFAVKQLANCLGMDILEFNLSQFDQPADLIGAFHQVRDKVLEGNTPCVFWDEFDSQDYKWLQYLLAPMQDGKFQQGEITHPIGKCVFVFAGGTSYTFAEFGKFMIDTPDGKQKDTIKEADFKMKKGPDFISRLSGYLNIKGINDLCTDDGNNCQPPDVMIPIRRAQLIRNMLGVKGNETLNIDPGLLNALIRIKKYEKGLRALEQILASLQGGYHHRFQRVNTPPAYILETLVNSYHDFLDLLFEDMTVDMLVLRVAPMIHNIWLKIADDEGWKMEYHKPFNRLPAHIQEDNFAAARRIAENLKIMNLRIVPKNEARRYGHFDFTEFCAEKDNLEIMAKNEHDGWCKHKEDFSGWKYASQRNDDRKLHNCLVQWDGSDGRTPLKDEDRKKDRKVVMDYEKILESAGFAIVRADVK